MNILVTGGAGFIGSAFVRYWRMQHPNDKVVVYDRVRENLRIYKKMPLRELIDRSINDTLNRTLGTSMTVFLACLPLALFGGEALEEFAWVLLFGIVIGTSSSIFIAAPSTTTLPVRIFLQIEDTIDPLVTAVSAALIYLTMIAIFVLDRAIGLEKLFVGKGRA